MIDIDASKNVGILCFSSDNLNFGANIVPFAMQKIIKSMGFTPSIIDISFTGCTSEVAENTYPMEGFRCKYLNLTQQICKSSQFYDLNRSISIFVVGSDQVWNTLNTKQFATKYFLDFAKENKGLIAYSASFGMETFIGNNSLCKKVTKLLKRFDFVSVRESSAIDVIHSKFDKSITCMKTIDPSFLLEVTDYDEIISDQVPQTTHFAPYIGFYMLSNLYLAQEESNFTELTKLSRLANMSLVDVSKPVISEEKQTASMGEWLNGIKNSSLFVTDSYHGVCLSIIFKKNFAYISRLGQTRVKNLLNELGLQDRIFNSFSDIDIEQISNSQIDYEKAYLRLQELKEDSRYYLWNALEKSYNKCYLKKNKRKKHIKFQKLKLMLEDFLIK